MREEWLGAWADSTEFIPDSLRNGIRLPPLTELELTRAVNEPAALEGTVTVDPAFATRLIRSLRTPDVFDLNETYVPPGLVQLVCHWLWCKVASSPARAIDWRLYETVGGLKQIRRELVWQGLKQSGGQEGLTTDGMHPVDRCIPASYRSGRCKVPHDRIRNCASADRRRSGVRRSDRAGNAAFARSTISSDASGKPPGAEPLARIKNWQRTG